MKQTIFTVVLVLIIAGLLSIVISGSKSKKTNVNAPIFFYGNTCPHCEDVEKWLKDNKVEEKLKITKKEVYDNKTNALELSKRAESCGLPTDSVGVPFLYTPEGKCYVGTPDIITYFSQKIAL